MVSIAKVTISWYNHAIPWLLYYGILYHGMTILYHGYYNLVYYTLVYYTILYHCITMV